MTLTLDEADLRKVKLSETDVQVAKLAFSIHNLDPMALILKFDLDIVMIPPPQK